MAAANVFIGSGSLNRVDLFRLQAFGALFHYKGYARSLFQAAIAAGLNSGKMYEYVLSVFTRNKSKAFRGVKPLHRSSFFHVC